MKAGGGFTRFPGLLPLLMALALLALHAPPAAAKHKINWKKDRPPPPPDIGLEQLTAAIRGKQVGAPGVPAGICTHRVRPCNPASLHLNRTHHASHCCSAAAACGLVAGFCEVLRPVVRALQEDRPRESALICAKALPSLPPTPPTCVCV